MEASYSELRARARQSLKGYWGRAVGATVFFGVITFIVEWLAGFLMVPGIILTYVISSAFALGLVSFFLSFARYSHRPVSDIFYGFNHIIKAFVLMILTTVFTLLWTLLLIVPGIIASFRYSMAYYILRDNPEISPLEAIRRSKAMMDGHKWRYFVLNLTFIGWTLLAVVTFGIGMLWLLPYIQVTMAHFYDDLLNRQAEQSIIPPSNYISY